MEAVKPKVLLCEDDTNLGMVLKNYLELNDYDVTLERDGRLGLAAFQREKYDICLLDVMMPDIDGIATFKALQADPQTAQIPVIFLTAKAQTSERRQFNDLGVSGVITKPFNSLDLPDQIMKMLDW